MKLRKFIKENDVCVDIYVKGLDVLDASTETGEVGKEMFTERGYQRFDQFLDAKVVDHLEYQKNGNIHILMGGTEKENNEWLNRDLYDIVEEITYFQVAMAGGISHANYDNWFKE